MSTDLKACIYDNVKYLQTKEKKIKNRDFTAKIIRKQLDSVQAIVLLNL